MPIIEFDNAAWVAPHGSGLDGIAGVNKNLTKTTGEDILNHV